MWLRKGTKCVSLDKVAKSQMNVINCFIATQLSRVFETHPIYQTNCCALPTVSNSCSYEQLNESKVTANAPTFEAIQLSNLMHASRRKTDSITAAAQSSQSRLLLLWLLTLNFSHVLLGLLGGEACRSMLSSVIKQWLFSPFQTTSCQGLWF